jgi:hypothetical protein
MPIFFTGIKDAGLPMRHGTRREPQHDMHTKTHVFRRATMPVMKLIGRHHYHLSKWTAERIASPRSEKAPRSFLAALIYLSTQA